MQDSCKHCDHREAKEAHLQQAKIVANPVSLWKPPQVAATCLDQATDTTRELPQTTTRELPQTSDSLQQAQELDPDIGPVLDWLKTDIARPSWEVAAPYSEDTKLYWAQWDSLCIHDVILYRAWESPKGDERSFNSCYQKS